MVLSEVPKSSLSLLFLLFILFSGCSGKHGAETVLTVPEQSTPKSYDEPLTKTEQAALVSKGQVDKDVPEHAMADVAKEYRQYLREKRGTVCAFSKQSEQYLAYARQVFRSKGMPEELANLAIVESGYKPAAVSRAGAAGAWQFMPGTGTKFGLTQDWWQDDRFDPYRATEAAADYLLSLYNTFGDWPTAVAAYNAGEGKMSRAMDGTGGKDFFEVKTLNHKLDEKAQLRDETKNYVPRFLAITKIMRNLPELGFEPIDTNRPETILRYTAEPGTDLVALSKACNLSWEEFNRYNSHHKRNITCTNRKTFVYVPSRAEKLAQAYLSHSDLNFANWQPTRVNSANDSLEKISKRSNIPLNRLQAANPGLSSLKAGQIIIAPTYANMTVPQNKPVKAVAGKTHKIKAKETLFSIAQRYNVTLNDLKAANGINNPNDLKLGQNLIIPAQPVKGGSTGKIGKSQRYVVRANDSLWNIAKRHNISVQDLKRWNKVSENNLKPGTELIVSAE